MHNNININYKSETTLRPSACMESWLCLCVCISDIVAGPTVLIDAMRKYGTMKLKDSMSQHTMVKGGQAYKVSVLYIRLMLL